MPMNYTLDSLKMLRLKNGVGCKTRHQIPTFRDMSFGIIPFTNVGYNYSASEWVNADKEAYYTNTYSGDGGLHQAYIGAGWEPVKGLAVGGFYLFP